jgi:hypothetical protein
MAISISAYESISGNGISSINENIWQRNSRSRQRKINIVISIMTKYQCGNGNQLAFSGEINGSVAESETHENI